MSIKPNSPEQASAVTPLSLVRMFFLTLSNLPPFVLLLIILATATLVTMLVMGTMDPHHHPRLAAFRHHHPTLSKLILCIAMFLPASFSFVPLHVMQFRSRKKSIPTRMRAESIEYLKRPVSLSIPAIKNDVWQRIKSNLPEEVIKTDDTRRAHWEIISIYEDRCEMNLQLRYSHVPLGQKPWQKFTRVLNCTVKLKGLGTKTQVDLLFNSRFPMDYRTIKDFIDQTQTNLSHIAVLQVPRELSASLDI